VRDGRRGDRRALLAEIDVLVEPIHCAGEQDARDQGEQQPVLEDDIGGK
jgi:hypothetical protein